MASSHGSFTVERIIRGSQARLALEFGWSESTHAGSDRGLYQS
jgi:hypothetical protein